MLLNTNKMLRWFWVLQVRPELNTPNYKEEMVTFYYNLPPIKVMKSSVSFKLRFINRLVQNLLLHQYKRSLVYSHRQNFEYFLWLPFIDNIWIEHPCSEKIQIFDTENTFHYHNDNPFGLSLNVALTIQLPWIACSYE